MSHEFVVKQGESGRVDRFLATKIADVSRARIQTALKRGNVLVNGETVDKSTKVREGDTVVCTLVDETVELATIHIPILHEDDDLLVLEKPVGVIVHPTQTSQEYTVAHFVKDHVPGIEVVGESPERPGIMHRLDRDVSGVMVVAKNQEAYLALKQQFQGRTVEKEYRAIVFGEFERNRGGDIRFAIGRSSKTGKMSARPEGEDGKDAWTEYEVLDTTREMSYLSIRIHTGRTHQIRVHMTAAGHPIAGDTLYTTKEYRNRQQPDRLLLHAHRLAFLHPSTGERVEFTSEVPAQFTRFLHGEVL